MCANYNRKHMFIRVATCARMLRLKPETDVKDEEESQDVEISCCGEAARRATAPNARAHR